MSISTHAEPGESSPYNHHLQQFLTFLKQERGFADGEPASTVKYWHKLFKKLFDKSRERLSVASSWPRS